MIVATFTASAMISFPIFPNRQPEFSKCDSYESNPLPAIAYYMPITHFWMVTDSITSTLPKPPAKAHSLSFTAGGTWTERYLADYYAAALDCKGFPYH